LLFGLDETPYPTKFCRSHFFATPSFLGAFGYIYLSRDKEAAMPQKVIEIVGTSKESFAKAAENAVAEAAKTVHGLKWARVAEIEMQLDDKKIIEYRATTRIYFDVKR
jgi:dodecin